MVWLLEKTYRTVMKKFQKIGLAGIGIALSAAIYGCKSEDPDQALAADCLKAYGRENLKDPQGAYLIDHKREKSSQIAISYSALNSIGGRERGAVRCAVKNNYELDEASSRTLWLLDELKQ